MNYEGLYDPIRYFMTEYLSYRDIANLGMTCRRLSKILNDSLFENLLKRDYKVNVKENQKRIYLLHLGIRKLERFCKQEMLRGIVSWEWINWIKVVKKFEMEYSPYFSQFSGNIIYEYLTHVYSPFGSEKSMETWTINLKFKIQKYLGTNYFVSINNGDIGGVIHGNPKKHMFLITIE